MPVRAIFAGASRNPSEVIVREESQWERDRVVLQTAHLRSGFDGTGCGWSSFKNCKARGSKTPHSGLQPSFVQRRPVVLWLPWSNSRSGRGPASRWPRSTPSPQPPWFTSTTVMKALDGKRIRGDAGVRLDQELEKRGLLR